MKNGNHRGHVPVLTALLTLMMLSSCGGGGGDLAGGGTGGTGIGPVTGFGSVMVNGIKYDDSGIDNTNFFDGNGRTRADLKVGMVLMVRAEAVNASTGTGKATRLDVVRHVDGPLDDNSVVLSRNRFGVMGQTVMVDAETVFDNVADLSAVDSLGKAGNRPELEVHGTADDNGVIHAWFVHLWAADRVPGRAVQLRGIVASLSPAVNPTSMTIGGQSIDLNGFAAPALNAFVEVMGTYRASDGALVAAQPVRTEDPSGGQNPGDFTDAEGFVKQVLSVTGASGRFELIGPNGLQVVNWSGANTAFKDGVSGDLAAGVGVEVEGTRNADKSVAATRISFRRPKDVRMDTTVTVPGIPDALTLFGKTVFVNSLTQYKDNRDEDPAFRLASIATGDTLRVAAFLDTTSTGTTRIVATRVERIDAIATDRHILQAPVDSFLPGGPNLVILGNLTVLAFDGATTFRDAEERPLDQAMFFQLLEADRSAGRTTVVKVRGNAFSPAVAVTANEAQIELGGTD
jgi:hypothetical protein